MKFSLIIKQKVNKIYIWRATQLGPRCDFRLLLYQYLRDGASWLAYYHTLILHTWYKTSFRLPQSFSDPQSLFKQLLRAHTSTPSQQCSFTLVSIHAVQALRPSFRSVALSVIFLKDFTGLKALHAASEAPYRHPFILSFTPTSTAKLTVLYPLHENPSSVLYSIIQPVNSLLIIQ